MTGILLLSHGSRDRDQRRQMDVILQGIKRRFPLYPVEAACLQFGEHPPLSGMIRLADAGADHILILPCFLFDGIHTKKHIPELIEQFCFQQKSISVTVGDVLGAAPEMIDIVSGNITKNIQE